MHKSFAGVHFFVYLGCDLVPKFYVLSHLQESSSHMHITDYLLKKRVGTTQLKTAHIPIVDISSRMLIHRLRNRLVGLGTNSVICAVWCVYACVCIRDVCWYVL